MKRYKVRRYNTHGDKRFWTWAIWDSLEKRFVKTGRLLNYVVDSPIKATIQDYCNTLNSIWEYKGVKE